MLTSPTLFFIPSRGAARAFEARYDVQSGPDSATLYSCAGLQDFLPRAVDFLKQGDNARHAEAIAHYLMGRAESDHLPAVCVPNPDLGIPWEVRGLLNDLLLTHRFGIFGKTEDPAKTIEKLEALSNRFKTKHYKARLIEWAEAASEQLEVRFNALTAIMQRISIGSTCFDLSGLGLTELPPLPDGLTGLDLSGNNLASLAGVPALKHRDSPLTFDRSLRKPMLFTLPSGMQENVRIDQCKIAESVLAEITLHQHNARLISTTPEAESLELAMAKWLDVKQIADIETWLDHAKTDGAKALATLLHLLPGCAKFQASDRNAVVHDIQTILNRILRDEDFRNKCFEECRKASESRDVYGDNGQALYTELFTKSATTGPLHYEAWRWLGGDTEKWKQFPLQEANALASLLNRLPGCVPFLKGAVDRDKSMDEVRGILERVLQDGIFREYCFVACHGAEADCHDRVQSLFDDLRLQMNNPARQENATVAAVVDFQRGLVASMLIDDYVFNIHAEHAQLRAQLPPELQAQLPLELLINYHALESAQLLRKELWKALKLPIPFKDIAHPRVALVNLDIKRHKNAALAYVLTNLTPERLSKQMAEDSSCNEFLRTQYPATFAAHSLLWVDAIDKLALKETRFKVDEENKRLTDHVNRTIKLTAEESLEAAHGLPHQGEGYLFKALKKSADEALFTVVSLHACVERTPEERTQWALNNLITNPQWLVYLQSWILKKKPDEEPDGNQVIWPAKPEEAPNQLIEWTKQVLLAEDQLVV